MNSKKIILLTCVILLCALLPLIIVFLPQPLAGKIFRGQTQGQGLVWRK